MLLNSSIGLNHRTKIKRSSTDIDQRKSYVRISVLLIRHMTKKLACWHIISIRLLLYKSTHQTNVNKKESNSTELAYYAEKSGKEENDKNLSIVSESNPLCSNFALSSPLFFTAGGTFLVLLLQMPPQLFIIDNCGIIELSISKSRIAFFIVLYKKFRSYYY
jgi:hypothetical protein